MYQFDPKNVEAFSKQIRKKILDLSFYAGSSSSHFGGALSSADIVAVLFGSIMNFNKKVSITLNLSKFSGSSNRFIFTNSASKKNTCLFERTFFHKQTGAFQTRSRNLLFEIQ